MTKKRTVGIRETNQKYITFVSTISNIYIQNRANNKLIVIIVQNITILQ